MAKPDLNTYRDRMDKAVSSLKEEFSGLRTGRANAGLLDPVQVMAYGSNSPLNSVAAISVPPGCADPAWHSADPMLWSAPHRPATGSG